MATSTKELIDWCEAEYDCTAKEKLEEVAQRLRELDMKIEKSDALNDSAYISGAQAGFNCALSDDVEALNKLITSRNGYLKPINCGGAVKSA